ncbi:MAG: M20/M25/M40 family metallo-hydrolase [Clostridia bacterium]|nr:M20/M25/M40 family metallo-hydrolase [Clostridia bacterium]
MKTILYIILVLLCLIVLLLLAAVIRTLLLSPKKTEYSLSTDKKRVDLYSEKLSKMVAMETVSRRGDEDIAKFLNFHKLLEELFPKTFAVCEKINIDGNLVLKWKGKNNMAPIWLMSHMDVVEANGDWQYPPFSGAIAEDKVWGRGSADTKCSLMAFLQATEEMIEEGYEPACDVYLASSCTEEIGGSGGPKLAAWLKKQGIKLFMLCDEGGSIVEEPVGGVPGNFAAVGIFEKGYGDMRFVAKSNGGHASAPKRNTPIVRLAKFVADVEKHYPFKSKYSPAVIQMFKTLSPYTTNFGLRFVFSNIWLFKPILLKVLPLLSAQGAAMVRTTIAFTMQSGSDGYNVIPQEATVSANLRFIPHQGADESIKVISERAAKFGVEAEVVYKGNPSNSLNLDGEQFKMVKECISKVFPGIGIMPYVVTGATDSRFYDEVCDNCVRFSPVKYGPEQMAGMHGLNENIEAGTLPGAVDYYKAIITAQESRIK